jgi:hypothetical protein
MYWLETEIRKGSLITEMTSADKLHEIQKYLLEIKMIKQSNENIF